MPADDRLRFLDPDVLAVRGELEGFLASRFGYCLGRKHKQGSMGKLQIGGIRQFESLRDTHEIPGGRIRVLMGKKA